MFHRCYLHLVDWRRGCVELYCAAGVIAAIHAAESIAQSEGAALLNTCRRSAIEILGCVILVLEHDVTSCLIHQYLVGDCIRTGLRPLPQLLELYNENSVSCCSLGLRVNSTGASTVLPVVPHWRYQRGVDSRGWDSLACPVVRHSGVPQSQPAVISANPPLSTIHVVHGECPRQSIRALYVVRRVRDLGSTTYNVYPIVSGASAFGTVLVGVTLCIRAT